MNAGDLVVAVPLNPETRRAYPKICGTYSPIEFEILGKKHQNTLVRVKTKDGVTGSIAVKPNTVRAASRRDQPTIVES